MKKVSQDDYLAVLQEREKESRVYQPFQQAGLDIAEILGDAKHRALYIKLAKEYDFRALFRLAKDIAEREGIKNKGAYFTKLFNIMLKEKKFR
ncbi:MAG: hypothetical protein Q8R20_01120, partial [Nanoarchaeota archaeon]|nr:hypothetical protein [Nanoarchaeota archaeon]